MAGNAVYQNGMDGGARRTLVSVAGNPIRTWDARGNAFRDLYDAAHRPTHRYVSTNGAPEILIERLVYGEGSRRRISAAGYSVSTTAAAA